MRTTIQIDDDVLKRLERIAERENRSRREVLNETLRRGLKAQRAADQQEPYRTQARDLGRCLVPSLDDVAEALAVAEKDDFR